MTRSEAYDQHPQHVLAFDPDLVRVQVRVGEQTLAESRRALRLREGSYPPVLYIPREDVRMDLLRRSHHTTHCPFKGDANYFDYAGPASTQQASADPHEHETRSQVAWSYEEPFDQMLAIHNHIAFYDDRVAIEVCEIAPGN